MKQHPTIVPGHSQVTGLRGPSGPARSSAPRASFAAARAAFRRSRIPGLPLHRSALALVVLLGFTAGCSHPPKVGQGSSATPAAHGDTAPAQQPVPRSKAESAAHAAALSEEQRRVRTFSQYAAGISSELNGEADQALKHFNAAAESSPTQLDLVLDVARRYLQRKEPAQAVALLSKAATQKPVAPEVEAWLGFALLQNKQTNDAQVALQKAIRRAPGNLFARQTLIQLESGAGRLDRVFALLGDASKQKSPEPVYWLQLGDLYTALIVQRPAWFERIKPRLVEAAGKAEALKPENPVLRQRVADLYRVAGEYSRAEVIYSSLLEKFPNALIRERLADIYLRLNRREDAVKQLEAIKREFPANPQVYYVLGGIASDEKKFKEAAQHFENAIRLNPDFEQAYYDLAGVLVSLNETEQALKTIGIARERFKQSFPLEFYTGVIHGRLKQYADAVKAYEAAEALAKDKEPGRLNYLFQFQIGAAYERNGQIPEAVARFRETLRLSPDFAEALNYLGYMWAEKGTNLDEARKMIERAVQLEPENGAFLDSLAWVLFKQGKPKPALQHMLKAIAVTKEPDATLFDHLGDIHAALGDLDKARDAWKKSLEVEDNPAIRKKLNGGT